VSTYDPSRLSGPAGQFDPQAQTPSIASSDPPPFNPPPLPPQPSKRTKQPLLRRLPVWARLVILGVVALAVLIATLVAVTNHKSPYEQGMAYDPPGDISVVLGVQFLHYWIASGDPYGLSTQAGAQWALGLEVHYEQRALVGEASNDGAKVTSVVVDPSTLTVSSAGLSFQAVLNFSDGSSGTVTVTDPLTGGTNGQYHASWN
jgi:hypothetical protein